MPAMLQSLKDLVLPAGETVERIRSGPMRGIRVLTRKRHSLQLLYGLWERETYPFIGRAASRCRWAIDIGAGAGELALALAASPGIDTVIAIDAAASVTARLAENAALNPSAGRLTIVTAMVGAPGHELDTFAVPRHERGFVKIDVDGGEIAVLESGRGLLGAGPRDLLIETHSAALEEGCIAFLEAHGYAVRIIPNAWWRALLPEKREGHNRWLWAERG
jgi:hypothetical protein